MVSGCSRLLWKTLWTCAAGGDVTACRRWILLSVKSSWWDIHRKWWVVLLVSDTFCHFRLCKLSGLSLCLSGVIRSGSGLSSEFWIFFGQLQLDHSVALWESVVCVGVLAAHHAPSGDDVTRADNTDDVLIHKYFFSCTLGHWKCSETCVVFFSPWTRAHWRTAMFSYWQAWPRSPPLTQTACWENFAVICVSFSHRSDVRNSSRVNISDPVSVCSVSLSAMTIRAGGNVLVPCYSSGVIYDLLECLYQFMDSANLGNTPFYFISPVANSSLEFSQIFAEWWDHRWISWCLRSSVLFYTKLNYIVLTRVVLVNCAIFKYF